MPRTGHRSWALALALVAAPGGGCHRTPPPRYLTEAVGRGPLADRVTATGELSARTRVNVGSQVSGTIARLHVDFNSEVRRGQLLAELDPRLLAAQLGRSRATVAVAAAELERAQVAAMDAERSLRRTAALFGKALVAEADRDAAEVARAAARAQVKGAEAGLAQARADCDLARTNLAFTRIVSPIDGVVIDRQVDVGQTVAAQFQVATLFTLASDLRQMELLASIDEADLGKVHAGMAARFTVDAYPDLTFAGRIRSVRPAPMQGAAAGSTTAASAASGQVVTYAAVIDADNPDLRLHQGMTAQVTLVAHERPDALRVANAALRFVPTEAGTTAGEAAAPGGRAGGDHAAAQDVAADAGQGGTPAGSAGGEAAAAGAPASAVAVAGGEPVPGTAGRVYLLVAGRPEARAVRLGISDGHRSEVLSGLAAGDVAIVADLEAGAEGAGRRRGGR